MAKRNRDIPPKAFRRFTYWLYVAPQRIVFDPRLPAQERIRRDFHLLLTASREEWNQQILPRYHLQYDAIENHPLYALTAYALDDKEWEQDPEAQQALKQLTPRQQACITDLAHSKWDTRIRWDWDTLLNTIADDQETFWNYYSDLPDKRAMSDGTRLRIIDHYRKKAIYLLGGGSHVSHPMRTACLKAGLLDERGRLPSPSLFSVNWWECRTRAEQRNAKLLTLHWFHHALRNLRNYRNNHRSLPWREECHELVNRDNRDLGQCGRVSRACLHTPPHSTDFLSVGDTSGAPETRWRGEAGSQRRPVGADPEDVGMRGLVGVSLGGKDWC